MVNIATYKELSKGSWSFPLHYVGNRGSGADHIMGTVLLSVLSGHWRYAHINGIRGDGVNPGLLGLSGTVSEDAVRTAMYRIEETAGLNWLSTQILGCISPALGLPWILDIDVTVKPLYGRRQGAEVGYHPQKPGRPSHVYHSYFVANLRISLGVEVRPGNEHAAAKGLPGLWAMLEKLTRQVFAPLRREAHLQPRRLRLWQRRNHDRARTARPALSL